MPQIENMPRARARALQQIGDVELQFRHRREQDRRIEISLDRRPVADIHPGLVDIDAPVDAEYVSAGGVKLAEKSGCARAEVDYRHARRADALDHGSGV